MSIELHVSFTATRALRRPAARREQLLAVIDEKLRGISSAARERDMRFYTGGAHGGDTYIAGRLIELYPDARHTLVLPDAPYNPAVELLAANEVIVMPDGTTYRDRNAELVRLGRDRVYAFPLHEERVEPRSGTWMTVRIARSMERWLDVTILDPTIRETIRS